MVVSTLRLAPRWSLLPRPEMRHAHLIGVAGSGMRALADVLLEFGWRVSGSDDQPDGLAALAARGLHVSQGRAAAHVQDDAHLVVHSDAVAATHLERRRAVELGAATLSYPQFLGALSTARATVAVAGTHGKSTTTAMAAAILARAGVDPAVLAGAAPLGRTSGGRAGLGEMLLVEACEFRRNFLQLRPRAVALLGIELDHVDCYASADDVADAFGEFAQGVSEGGLVLANADCRRTMDAASRGAGRLVTFGLQPWAEWWAGDLHAERGRYTFRLFHRGRHASTIRLRTPGMHNVRNALAAAALAAEHGASMRSVHEALEDFAGLERRLERLPTRRGVARVDDYAHHPTAVAAALAAVRAMYPGRHVACVFEPHQVARTARLLDDYARSLHNADTLWIAPVYRAREATDAATAFGTAAELAQRVWVRGGDALACRSWDEIVSRLRAKLSPGHVLVTLGAGCVRNVQHELD